jgi:aldose 1-epimerase
MTESTVFGHLPDGREVRCYELSNARGFSAGILNYGGIIQSLQVPDASGDRADVVLGFGDLDSYLRGHPYFGCIVGRVAGRISGGKFSLGGRSHRLALNDPPNHLHGGVTGLDKRLWEAEVLADGITLRYHSADGEEGYPGAVDFTVTYRVTEENELIIASEALTSAPTPVSLTNHSYFNLAGEGRGTIEDHELQILADEYVPADEHMTLSGRRKSVSGGPNDLRVSRRLGEIIPGLHGQHGENYLLRSGPAGVPALVARLVDPASGRWLDVFSDEECLQFYSGLKLDGTLTGKSGAAYGPHTGLCLECQGYPDAIGDSPFESIVVVPGAPRRRTTKFVFGSR